MTSRFMAFLNPFHQQFAEGVEKFRELGGVDLVKVRRGHLSKIQYLKGKDGQDKGNNDIDLEDLQSVFTVLGIGCTLSFISFLPVYGIGTVLIYEYRNTSSHLFVNGKVKVTNTEYKRLNWLTLYCMLIEAILSI
jgi:hypothetical protein